eukprot:IDg22265t1
MGLIQDGQADAVTSPLSATGHRNQPRYRYLRYACSVRLLVDIPANHPACKGRRYLQCTVCREPSRDCVQPKIKPRGGFRARVYVALRACSSRVTAFRSAYWTRVIAFLPLMRSRRPPQMTPATECRRVLRKAA